MSNILSLAIDLDANTKKNLALLQYHYPGNLKLRKYVKRQALARMQGCEL